MHHTPYSSSLSSYLDTEVETFEAEVAVRITSYEFFAFIRSGHSRCCDGGGECKEYGDGLHDIQLFFDIVESASEVCKNECLSRVYF